MKEELGNVRTKFYFSDFLFPCGVIFVRKKSSYVYSYLHNNVLVNKEINKSAVLWKVENT